MSSSVFSEFVFWLAATVCVVAQVAVVRAAVAGRTPGASSSMATRVREFFWVVLPAAILVLVLVWTWRSLPSRAGNTVMDSQAIGTLAPGSGMGVS